MGNHTGGKVVVVGGGARLVAADTARGWWESVAEMGVAWCNLHKTEGKYIQKHNPHTFRGTQTKAKTTKQSIQGGIGLQVKTGTGGCPG